MKLDEGLLFVITSAMVREAPEFVVEEVAEEVGCRPETVLAILRGEIPLEGDLDKYEGKGEEEEE